MQTLPREITGPSFFAPQNHGDFVLCLAKLWSNADFAQTLSRSIVHPKPKPRLTVPRLIEPSCFRRVMDRLRIFKVLRQRLALSVALLIPGTR